MIIVRKAEKTDINGLHEIMLEISDYGIADKELGKRQIAEMAMDDRQYLMVAVDTETQQIVGSVYGIVFPDICDYGRPILLVENVAVRHDCQGRGIGRIMMDEIEAFAHSHNCHYEMLVSGLERVGAHKFYKRLEFEEKKAFKKYFE